MKNQDAYNMAITRNRVMDLDEEGSNFSDEDIEMYRRVSSGEKLEGMAQYRYYNTDWNDQLYRSNAPQRRTNVSVSGGNNTTKYCFLYPFITRRSLE